jgi:DNA polymerase/3'-5' exonuclease PolX
MLAKEMSHYFRQNSFRMTKSSTEYCNDNVEICDKKMTLIKNLNQKICGLINTITEED